MLFKGDSLSIDAISCIYFSSPSLNEHFDRVAPDFHVGHEADQYLDHSSALGFFFAISSLCIGSG